MTKRASKLRLPPPERGRSICERSEANRVGVLCVEHSLTVREEIALTPTRLAEFIIGPRFARTRWLADLPLAGGGNLSLERAL